MRGSVAVTLPAEGEGEREAARLACRLAAKAWSRYSGPRSLVAGTRRQRSTPPV